MKLVFFQSLHSFIQQTFLISLLCAATEIGAGDTIMDGRDFLPLDFTI